MYLPENGCQVNRLNPMPVALRMYTRSHQKMYDLLLEAKLQYESETESRVVVYILDQASLKCLIFETQFVEVLSF